MGNQQTKGERFLQAASQGDTFVVQQYIAEAGDQEKLLLKTRTGFLRHNESALHVTAKHGKLYTLSAILGPIVDAVTAEIAAGSYPGKAATLLTQVVNLTDSRGRTPFLTACYNGHWDCAEQLLEAGSNFFVVDKDGNSCLHLAAIRGHENVIAQLITKAENEAITLRLASIINLSGFTPLHYAAHAGSAEVTRQLLSAGVDPLQTSWGEYDRWLNVPPGSTALHVAAMSHHSGVCIMLLQHHALQMRDWVPGQPRPVDPRTRIDNCFRTPVDSALWKGLAHSSQLAMFLDPRYNIADVFSLEQLDNVRRRGPAALKVLAAAAVKGNLLQELGQVQEQQRHARLLQQQQQQQDDHNAHNASGIRDWQRWWARLSTDRGSTAAAAAAASATAAAGSSTAANTTEPLSQPGHSVLASSLYQTTSNAAAAAKQNGSSCSSGAMETNPCSSSSSKDNSNSTLGVISSGSHVDDYLLGLKRTPSITLGAVQYTSSSMHDLQQQQQQQQQPEVTAAAAGPICVYHPLDMSAAAAAAADRRDHDRGLQSSSSITLGCLDQIWSVGEQQQQQVVMGSLAAAELSQQQQQQQRKQQPIETEIETVGQEAVSDQQQQSPPSVPTPDAAQQGSRNTTAAAVEPSQAGHPVKNTYEHINEQIHKATGCTDKFVLVLPQQKVDADESDTLLLNSNVKAAAAAAQIALTADEQQQQQQQQQQVAVPATPEPPQQQQLQKLKTQRSLGANSITLGQLQRSKSSNCSLGNRECNSSSDSSSSNALYHDSSCVCRYPSNIQRVLSTAGIKNQQNLTPFTIRLLQQQDKGYAARIAQQQQDLVQGFNVQPASKAAAASSSSSKAPGGTNSQVHSGISCMRTSSFHRRSLEVPGSTGGRHLAAVFGASKQHITRMLKEAGTTDPQSLYRSLAVNGGTLAVATSLAGALPGCVSTKLVQCVDLSRTSSLAQVHGVNFEAPGCEVQRNSLLQSSLASVTPSVKFSSSRRSCSSEVGSSGCEVCAICADRSCAVAVSPCGHVMCFECVRCIIEEGVGCRAPLCPYCRMPMTGFALAVAPAAATMPMTAAAAAAAVA